MEEKKDEYKVVLLPKWVFIVTGCVLGLVLFVAVLNLGLNFLDARARARYDATLDERARRLDSLERRVDKLER